MIDLTRTLGDLVTEDPRRARVLEELGLDYCCHGQRSLEQAAGEQGLTATEVAARLDLPERAAAPQWQSLGMAGLADHIEEVHHGYLWGELRGLGELVAKVHSVHGDRHPELAQVFRDYVELANELAAHLQKEERILFPAIRSLDGRGEGGPGCGVLGPIRQMMFEHDHAGDLLVSLRASTRGYAMPEDGCESYRQMLLRLEELEADLHEHIHKENNVLFPRALEADAAAHARAVPRLVARAGAVVRSGAVIRSGAVTRAGAAGRPGRG